MRRIFGSRSDPGTPTQGTTPMNRSRASSSTRHADDAYMDDVLNAENPGVNDIMMGAAALPLDNQAGFGTNPVAGARERDHIFAAETTAPTAPVLAPTVPIINPLLTPLPPNLAATLPVMAPTTVAPAMSAPRRLLSAPPPAPAPIPAPAPAPAPAPLSHGPLDGGSNVRQEEVRGQVAQVLELADHLNHANVSGNRVHDLLTSVCSKLMKDQLDHVRLEHEAAMGRLQSQLENRMDLQKEMYDMHPFAPYHCGRAQIPPPRILCNNETLRTHIDRFWKVDRLYKSIAPFDDDGSISVRTFLNGLVSVTNTFPPSMNLTREEYFRIVWSKLGPTVQGELMDRLDEFAEDPELLHEALLANYDVSERGEDAFFKLQSLKPSAELGTVNKLLREAKRLRQLTNGSDAEQARSFATSLRAFLPYRLKKKLEDLCIEYTHRTKKVCPDWSFLTSFATAHRDEIEENVQKVLKRPAARQVQPAPKTESKRQTPKRAAAPPVVVAQLPPPLLPPPQIQQVAPPPGPPPQVARPLVGIPQQGQLDYQQQSKAIAAINEAAFKAMFCDLCQKPGHDRGTCFRRMKCTECQQVGHTAERCRTFCRLCGYRSHASVNCRLYSGQVPMTDPCKYCQGKYGAILFHSEQSCRIRKAEKNE